MPLVVNNIHAGYSSDINVLKGVSLTVRNGRVTAVLGPNGSGKSTLLKTIYGFIKPISGRITLDDIDITGRNPYEMPRLGVAYVSQEKGIFPKLTVEENLKTGLWIHRRNRTLVNEKLHEIYERFPVLRERRRDKASFLSGGQQRVLQIAKALLMEPRYILLDEPSTGLSPIAVEEIFKILENLKKERKSILLVEQNVRKALTIADDIYIIELGQNKVSGTKEEIEDKLADILGIWGFRK